MPALYLAVLVPPQEGLMEDGDDGFVKIYGDRLLGSSLMDEALETRWLFICFASKANAEGFVRCQTTGTAARLANLTEEQAQRALDALSSPDPNSTTPDYEGRRILRADGGWLVVNHQKYRDLRTRSQAMKAARQRRWREGHKASTRDARDARETEVSASASVSVSVPEGVQGEGRRFPANPLVSGRRPELEAECLALVRRMEALTGEDPVEIIARASDYKGAPTTKLNPASMSDDRLLHTIRDLRADVAAEEAKHGAPKR